MKLFLKSNFKILTFFFVLSIALSVTLVKAYDSPDQVQIIRNDLRYNNYVAGATYNKNTYGILQRVYNSETFTAFNNPCTSCQIGVRLKEGTEQRAFVTTQMGETVSLGTYSQYEGNYHLEMARYDYSLLTTYSYGTWYINV